MPCMKRKLDCDDETTTKHIRLNQSAPDLLETEMAWDSSSPNTPFLTPDHSPSMYPRFELYPEVPVLMDCDSPASSSPSTPSEELPNAIGLLQPKAPTQFAHHGTCSQIPRLRLSSHPGQSGTRSLWSHCLECGAIEQVSC
ncbi:hypothetical protein BOTBODRAFT_25803 [Botryobasidium botryosum FD-172 SS1]|uniref:Uncharacterized protein n=1 Tax=Botryobasidium botryosum (strain FD-172 SS1) TaxID=930990 RepID=A0A067N067_BOTB1|nr:hypothetical protein BOTBODRAFT_25803 [Botryobasidium botryosum FD-172 SS1]